MTPLSQLINKTTHKVHPAFSLSRISIAILFALSAVPAAIANCTADSGGMDFTCSGSVSDHTLLDLTGQTGNLRVTFTPDFTTYNSLYIGNKWDFTLNSGSAEPWPSSDGDGLLRADSLSVVLSAGDKLSQSIAADQTALNRLLFVDGAAESLSVIVDRDLEQVLDGAGGSSMGYLHVVDVRNSLSDAYYIPEETAALFTSTENAISVNGNITQTVENSADYSISGDSVPYLRGGLVALNAEISGVKNRVSVTGDITQSVSTDNLYGSFSGSMADIAAIKIFSNSINNAYNYSAVFLPLEVVGKAENVIDISGNVKQEFILRDRFDSYVQSGSNFVNNAVFVNLAGISNQVSISGDVERTVSADTMNEMVGSGINVQANLYDSLNTGMMSKPATPDNALFMQDVVNNIDISGNVKQSVMANEITSDTSASSGRQAFSTVGVQVLGSQNTISVSGDVSKEIDVGESLNMSPGSAILVQANATPLGQHAMFLDFSPEIWDMVARTENIINVSGNVTYRISGGQQAGSLMYGNLDASGVDISANGVKNVISVAGDIERTFSGEYTSMPLSTSSALAVRSNITRVPQFSSVVTHYAPSADTLENTQNIISIAGDVSQDIRFQSADVPNYYGASGVATELFAIDIAVAGRNSTLLISGDTSSNVSVPADSFYLAPSHAGGINLKNYYGDLNALITGSVTVTDGKDVAGSLLNIAPTLCLTTMTGNCPGGEYENDALRFAAVGIRAVNDGDSLNLALEGDVLSSGIGVQVRPSAEIETVTTADDGVLSRGNGDVTIDVAARLQGQGGYALDASQMTQGRFTLGLRDNWTLEGAAYAAYSNPDNTLLLHGDSDSGLDLTRLTTVGEWEWIDGEGNLSGYTLSGEEIANFHHLEKDGASTWVLTGSQTDSGFRDGVIRSGALVLENATLLMDKTARDDTGNTDDAVSYSGLLSIEAAGVLGTQGESFIHGGDVINAGLVNLNTDGSAANRLTIDGNYTSDGGMIAFGSVLGGDDSATDHLTITGNTAGTGTVSVSNLGGYGAQTIEGIELISVGGSSEAMFTKASRIVAGAYDYDLVKKAGNWYLTSQFVPTPSEEEAPSPEVVPPVRPGEVPDVTSPPSVMRPEAGSYWANQVAANTLFLMRLHDRGGERQRTDPVSGKEMNGMWMRHEFGASRSRDSSGQLNSDAHRYVVQMGIDLLEGSSNGRDHLVGGLMAGYGKVSSKTTSKITDYASRGTAEGWSAGIYGTWFADAATQQGTYVDSWLLYNRFNNSVSGDELAAEKYRTRNVMASLETGYTFKLGETKYDDGHRRHSYIQPQAQIVHTFGGDVDHTEHNGTRVSSDGDNTLVRLGVRVFMKEEWRHTDGNFREFEPYGEMNWITSNAKQSVSMNDITVHHKGMKNALELRTGIRGQVTDNLSLWTDVTAKSGEQGYRDYMGQIGLKYDF